MKTTIGLIGLVCSFASIAACTSSSASDHESASNVRDRVSAESSAFEAACGQCVEHNVQGCLDNDDVISCVFCDHCATECPTNSGILCGGGQGTSTSSGGSPGGGQGAGGGNPGGGAGAGGSQGGNAPSYTLNCTENGVNYSTQVSNTDLAALCQSLRAETHCAAQKAQELARLGCP